MGLWWKFRSKIENSRRLTCHILCLLNMLSMSSSAAVFQSRFNSIKICYGLRIVLFKPPPLLTCSNKEQKAKE